MSASSFAWYEYSFYLTINFQYGSNLKFTIGALTIGRICSVWGILSIVVYSKLEPDHKEHASKLLLLTLIYIAFFEFFEKPKFTISFLTSVVFMLFFSLYEAVRG